MNDISGGPSAAVVDYQGGGAEFSVMRPVPMVTAELVGGGTALAITVRTFDEHALDLTELITQRVVMPKAAIRPLIGVLRQMIARKPKA